TSGNPPEHLEGATLSANVLKLLGIQPALGRGFTPQETQPGRDTEVILSYQLWQRQFGGKRGVIGKTIQLDDAPYTIIGVMPKNFYFIWDDVLDVLTPLALPPSRWTETGRASRDLQALARLKPGVTHDQAQMEMNTIASRLAAQYPQADKGWGIKVEPLHAAYHRHIAMPLIVIISAAFLVLLIACVNVANLLLVRSTTRRKEIAVRIAMGATRRRLLSQLITESVLLGFIGGLVGILFSYAGVRLLALGCARYYPVIGTQWMSLNGSVLAFCLGLAILTGVVFGLAPAFQASKMDLNEPLKESGVSVTAEAGRRRLRNGLVVCEVCFAMVLMVGAGLLIRTFVNILQVDNGFDPHNVLDVYLSLPDYKYQTPAKQAAFFQEVFQRARSLPGVEAAGGTGSTDEMLFNAEGYPPASPDQQPSAQTSVISPRFFRMMKTPLIEGREFARSDDQAAPRVAIINQTLAHRYFPNVNPIGRHLIPIAQVYGAQSSSAPAPLEIVGVVKDLKGGNYRENTPQVFIPFLQDPTRGMELLIRTATPPLTLTSAVRSMVKSMDSELPVSQVGTLEDNLTRMYGYVSFPYIIVWVFAALALVLSAVGIFGVISYSVTQRTHEMAIRMALGAQPKDVLRLILAEGLRTTGLGLVIGVFVSLALGRLIQSFLFGVRSYDPLTLIVVMLVMAAVAVLASYFPARRATKVDPVVALRYE
ncbi:MAG TPA: ABC transporter permease, partial [Terriglobia bacterium]|nr:ABC transporter permease [Terriglobia bacterium]